VRNNVDNHNIVHVCTLHVESYRTDLELTLSVYIYIYTCTDVGNCLLF